MGKLLLSFVVFVATFVFTLLVIVIAASFVMWNFHPPGMWEIGARFAALWFGVALSTVATWMWTHTDE